MNQSDQPKSYGSDHNLTFVDRFGVWLSARKLRRFAGSFRGKVVGDFGCGYNATFSRAILPEVSHLFLADHELAEDLRSNSKITASEGNLEQVTAQLPSSSLDLCMCVSVLEHLVDPPQVLREFRRLLKPGGLLLVNVPSWRGKFFLELSAFRLSLSPAESIDDHKMYYDPKDLWIVLVASGFAPSSLKIFRHKFGLNTFAVCRA